MPELPEVENVKLSLEGLGVGGQTFAEVILRRANLRTPLKKELSRKLPGQTLRQILRRAKFLLFETDDFLIVSHLGMTGSWRQELTPEFRTHDHVVFQFQSGLKLIFNDPRRFGILELATAAKPHPWLQNLGPEPFDPQFSPEHLFQSTRGITAPIKNFIMDQRRVVGVGNIYASEVLFLAGVRPTRPAHKLTRAEAGRLVENIRTVLAKAITAGGSTIRDYRNSNGEEGRFQQQFTVYGRDDDPCVQCGKPLRCKMLAGRNTFWCTACQC